MSASFLGPAGCSAFFCSGGLSDGGGVARKLDGVGRGGTRLRLGALGPGRGALRLRMVPWDGAIGGVGVGGADGGGAAGGCGGRAAGPLTAAAGGSAAL